MRSVSLSLLLLASLWALALAWTKEDHEIFRLKDEIDQHEGQGSTFYDFLQIPRSASQSEINKAYRKRSRTLHPDKAKQSLIASRAAAKPTSKPGAKPTTHVNKPPTAREIRAAEKEASERFTRLGLVTEILRGEGRARYDHFLDNGFPAWRGTGFYYERFRPGIGSVLTGLFIFGGGLVHYIVLILGYKRQRDFVGRYIRQAQRAAWGDEGKTSILRNVRGLGGNDEPDEAEGATVIDEDYDVPDAPRNRRERRQAEKESRMKKKKDRARDRSVSADPRGTATPSEAGGEPVAAGNVTPAPGPKKQVEAENGKVLVVDSQGKVFLEEEDEESGESRLFLLDPEEIERPTFKQTVLWRLPVWVAGLVRERVKGTKGPEGEDKQQGGHVKEKAVEEGSEEDMGDVIVVSKEEGLNGGKASVNGAVDVGGGNGKKGRKRKGKK